MEDLTEIKYNRSFFGVVTSMFLDHDNGKLYAGKGNFLLIYNIQNNKMERYIQVFASNKILKIKKFNYDTTYDLLILLGETEIKYYLINKSKEIIPDNNKLFSPIKTQGNDYLTDTLITKNKYLILGFINNYIELYKIDINQTTSTLSYEYINTFFCPKKCIVYSMAFYYNQKDNSISIASGTVFRQIKIWFLHLSQENKYELEENNQIDLLGHEGVTFSVQFINENTLISTSDDRTTRKWILDLTNNKYESKNFFGHSSRVWDSISNSNKNLLVSISEDSTGRVYNLDNGEFLYELRNGHLGKSIKSVEMNDEFIWTGGEDGQIIKWKITDKLLTSKNKNVPNLKIDDDFKNKIIPFSLPCDDDQGIMAKTLNKNFNPSISALIFLNYDNLIIGTNHGLVENYNISERKIDKVYFRDNKISVVISLDIIFNKYLLIGLTEGIVHLVEIDNIHNNKSFIVFENVRITFLSHKYLADSNDLFIIASSPLSDSKIFYLPNVTEDSINFNILCEYLNVANSKFLPVYTGRNHSCGIGCFEVIKLLSCSNTYMIFLGDYLGNIYFLKAKKITNVLFNFNTIIKFLNIHNDSKITNIYHIPSNNKNDEDLIIYTYSRDGKNKKFQIKDAKNNNFTIKEIDFKSEINSYEKILFDNITDIENQNYYIIGHLERNMLIYDKKSNLNIHINDVKGLNHPMDALLNSKESTIRYGFSVSKDLKIVTVNSKHYNLTESTHDSQNVNELISYNVPIHGRVIHCISLTLIDPENNTFLLSSGSEDTKINFYFLKYDGTLFDENNMKLAAQFLRHECAIRRVKAVDCIYEEGDCNKKRISEIIFLSIASKGEAYLFKLKINYSKISCDVELISDLSLKSTNDKNKNSKNLMDNDLIENTRNMDCTFIKSKKCDSCINYKIIFSNTVAMTYYYEFNSLLNKDFQLINKYCFKNINSNFIALSINVIQYDDKDFIILYGLTNGNLNIYNSKDKTEKCFKIQEAGINDIKIIKQEKSFIICTCGEDCSIVLSELIFIDSNYELKKLLINRKIHFSAIKQLSINELQGNKFIITSGSYDQLINISVYDINKNEMKRIKRIKCCVSEINSISTFLYDDKKELFISASGQGIEFFKEDLNNKI